MSIAADFNVGKTLRWLLAFGVLTSVASAAIAASNVNVSGPPATTRTEVVSGRSIAPILSLSSAQALLAAEEKYAEIAANGGWQKLAKAGLKKGATGGAVEDLNKRLYVEGYLRQEATQGEFAEIFTTATQDALQRYQANHGLAVTGQLDKATLAALNVPVRTRLQAIRQNIPRLKVYADNLGDRYVVVNVPSQQIETVSNGRVYSRHNAIVGRPERPTPVVMTAVSDVKFNPYWNAPASIVERDIIPKILNGTQLLQDMDMKVFQGFGGPEIDPDDVDWGDAVADDYHFRQEPGPENAMATAKVDFVSPFGIYLHDTPEKHLFKAGRRFFSSGCVRVEKMDVLLQWLMNGQDGYTGSKIAALAETLERVDVKVTTPPQLRVVYLTAWPVGNTVAFRNDIYELDNSGFTVGQPMPVGELSPDGQRYTLKPLPRLASQVDDSGGFFLFGGGKKAKKPDGTPSNGPSIYDDELVFDSTRGKNGIWVRKSQADTKPAKKSAFVKANKPEPKKVAAAKKKSTGFSLFGNSDDKKTAEKSSKTKDKSAKALAAKKVNPKPDEKKSVLGSKIVAKKSNPTAEAKVKTANPAEKLAAKAPADPKATAKKPVAVKCVADSAGKLPKGCPVPAAKTAAKTAAKADPAKPAAN